jgi:hypothetical protein
MPTSTRVKGGARGLQGLRQLGAQDAQKTLHELQTQLSSGNGTKSGILRLRYASDSRGNDRHEMVFERKTKWNFGASSDTQAHARTADAVRILFERAGLPVQALDRYLARNHNKLKAEDFQPLLKAHVEALDEVNQRFDSKITASSLRELEQRLTQERSPEKISQAPHEKLELATQAQFQARAYAAEMELALSSKAGAQWVEPQAAVQSEQGIAVANSLAQVAHEMHIQAGAEVERRENELTKFMDSAEREGQQFTQRFNTLTAQVHEAGGPNIFDMLKQCRDFQREITSFLSGPLTQLNNQWLSLHPGENRSAKLSAFQVNLGEMLDQAKVLESAWKQASVGADAVNLEFERELAKTGFDALAASLSTLQTDLGDAMVKRQGMYTTLMAPNDLELAHCQQLTSELSALDQSTIEPLAEKWHQNKTRLLAASTAAIEQVRSRYEGEFGAVGQPVIDVNQTLNEAREGRVDRCKVLSTLPVAPPLPSLDSVENQWLATQIQRLGSLEKFDEKVLVTMRVVAQLSNGHDSMGLMMGTAAEILAEILGQREAPTLTADEREALLAVILAHPEIQYSAQVEELLEQADLSPWNLLSQSTLWQDPQQHEQALLAARQMISQVSPDAFADLFSDEGFQTVVAKFPELCTLQQGFSEAVLDQLKKPDGSVGAVLQSVPSLHRHPAVLAKAQEVLNLNALRVTEFVRACAGVFTQPEVLQAWAARGDGQALRHLTWILASDKEGQTASNAKIDMLREAVQKALSANQCSMLEDVVALQKSWAESLPVMTQLMSSLGEVQSRLVDGQERVEVVSALQQILPLEQALAQSLPDLFANQANSIRMNHLFVLEHQLRQTGSELPLCDGISALRQIYLQSPKVEKVIHAMRAGHLMSALEPGDEDVATFEHYLADPLPEDQQATFPLIFLNVNKSALAETDSMTCSIGTYLQAKDNPNFDAWDHFVIFKNTASGADPLAEPLKILQAKEQRLAMHNLKGLSPILTERLQNQTAIKQAIVQAFELSPEIGDLFENGFRGTPNLDPRETSVALGPTIESWLDVSQANWDNPASWVQLGIKPAHLAQLKALAHARGVDADSPEKFAQFMLAASILFTNLGSVGQLGDERESVLTLRAYGYALFRQARDALIPQLAALKGPTIAQDTLQSIDAQFREAGICSQLLSMSTMRPNLMALSRDVYLRMIPPKWMRDEGDNDGADNAITLLLNEASNA